MMHGPEKSDPTIVAGKPANKAEQPPAERSAGEPNAAERVEPRVGTKGNAGQQSRCRTQRRASLSQELERIRQVARERRKERFTALFHHISIELLEAAFFELKKDAAPGVDRLTWKDYEADFERHIEDLHHRATGERIGHCPPGGCTSPSRMAGSARSRSPRWRTRLSNERWPHC